jgi:hypothetical protein
MVGGGVDKYYKKCYFHKVALCNCKPNKLSHKEFLMTSYQTTILKNLSTGQSFTCMIDEKHLATHLKSLKWHTENYASSGMARKPKSVILEFEFALLPSFKQVLRIWTRVSEDDIQELLTRMILDFGCPEAFLQKILLDSSFINKVREILTGITCDGGRAARAMRVVYDLVASHYSPDQSSQDVFMHE